MDNAAMEARRLAALMRDPQISGAISTILELMEQYSRKTDDEFCFQMGELFVGFDFTSILCICEPRIGSRGVRFARWLRRVGMGFNFCGGPCSELFCRTLLLFNYLLEDATYIDRWDDSVVSKFEFIIAKLREEMARLSAYDRIASDYAQSLSSTEDNVKE